MNKMNPTIHTKQQGFTIVELLIVIVVIAILAAISVAAYNGVRERADNSAMQSELSQIYRKIQVDAVQDGNSISIQPPIAYLAGTGTRNLTKNLENAQEITLYTVLDTNGDTSASWGGVVRLKPHVGSENGFWIRTGAPGVGNTNPSYSTSAQSDQNINCGALRNTTGRHAAWITAAPGTIGAGCDANLGTFRVLSTHNGWNFDSIELFQSTPGAVGVATIVFPGFHDEVTRAQVLRWLDGEYNLDFYP